MWLLATVSDAATIGILSQVSSSEVIFYFSMWAS